MREYSTPPVVELGPAENLTDMIFSNAAEAPDSVSLARNDGGRWVDVTARQYAAEVTALAKGLVAAGVSPGDRVGLMCKTRYEWTLADFAILTAGAVTVPIYETSSAEQVAWNLLDSEAVAVIVETAEHRATYQSVAGQLPAMRCVWQIEAGDLETLATSGESVSDDEIARRRAGISGDSLATIIYTSGTTGRPKGCELSHRNFLYHARTTTTAMSDVFSPGTSTLLFLPLAHSLARVSQYGAVAARVRLGHSGGVATLMTDLVTFRPTFIIAVPRVFEKVYNGAKTKAHAASTGKGRIFDLADATAVRYSQALDKGRPGPVLAARHALFDKLVYGKIRAALGGEVRWAISGGAPLGGRLGHFFRGVGITVLEGYGLTETAAGSTLNRPDDIRIGTVGKPIPGVSVRISPDGEILLRGDLVFGGYWHNEVATKEALEPDGWFPSGDIGELDEAGFLRITGRKKEIIVTSGGKNVAPAMLEDALRAAPLVSQCLVIGDSRPYIVALITLDAEALAGWQAARGKPGVGTPSTDPELTAVIDGAVAAANRTVSRAEGIRRYRILDVDFTEDGGHMTPTLKLKRSVIERDFGAEIDALYDA